MFQLLAAACNIPCTGSNDRKAALFKSTPPAQFVLHIKHLVADLVRARVSFRAHIFADSRSPHGFERGMPHMLVAAHNILDIGLHDRRAALYKSTSHSIRAVLNIQHLCADLVRVALSVHFR